MEFLKKAAISLALTAFSVLSIGGLFSSASSVQAQDRWDRHDRRVERRIEHRREQDERWMYHHHRRMTGYYDSFGRFHPSGYYDSFGYFHPYRY